MGLAVSHKEVVLSILGASAALSGLVLVFLGLVAGEARSFSAGTKPAIVARARRPAVAVLVSFAVGIVCLSLTMAWLLYPRSGTYFFAVGMFVAQLASLVGATTWVVRSTLWG